MDILGYDTVIFTATDRLKVANSIFSQVILTWPNVLVEIENKGEILKKFSSISSDDEFRNLINDDHSVVSFVKNMEMCNFFEDNSYQVFSDGEGPISYHIRKRSGIFSKIRHFEEVDLEETNDPRPPSPYSAFLCSDSITELTVVTPENPNSDKFSRWAVRVLMNACYDTEINIADHQINNEGGSG